MITYHHHVKNLSADFIDACIHSGDLLEFRRQDYHTLRLEWQVDYQLLYIVDGYGHFWFGGKEEVAEPGCAVLYAPGETQEYGYTEQEGVLVYCCHFIGEGILSFLRHYPIPTGQILRIGSRQEISALFEEVVADQGDSQAPFLALLRLLRTVFLRLPLPTGQEPDLLAPALADLQEKYMLDRTVEEYAAMCHLSKYHFLRIFKRRTGKTVIEYRNEYRLDVADRLLANSDLTVEAAALAVGFSSAAYFCRVYKKSRGHSCRA